MTGRNSIVKNEKHFMKNSPENFLPLPRNPKKMRNNFTLVCRQ